MVASIHWGSNWGYRIPSEQIRFAHELVSQAGIDVIHGHSSHHARPFEVYRGKLILYGCGDFINDYEGIQGYEGFRDDLALMYFASIDPVTGKLASLRIVPMQIKNFRLNRVSREDALWLRDTLNREGKRFGTSVILHATGQQLDPAIKPAIETFFLLLSAPPLARHRVRLLQLSFEANCVKPICHVYGFLVIWVHENHSGAPG